MGIIDLHNWQMIIVQLLVATLCGGLIGYQRETSDRPAGFRTHILVCVGSAVYMLVSVAVAGDKFDPGRIAAQVASGIGFLGAGTIIKQGSIVRGLTTAASLWTVAGIGLAAGFGGPTMTIAAIGTIVVFLALSLLRQMEIRFEGSRRIFNIDITLADARRRMEWVKQILNAHGIEQQRIAINEQGDGVGIISIEGRVSSEEESDSAVGELMKGEGVSSVNQQFR